MANLSEIIKTKRELLCNTELPSAKCIHLSELLAILNSDKNIEPILSLWHEEIDQKNQLSHQKTAKSVDWIKEKINQLKLSKWANHPIIKHTLELAETIIFCNELPSDLLNDQNKLAHYDLRVIRLAISSIYR